MAGRRAITEAMLADDSDEAIDLNNLRDDELQALAMAYAMQQEQNEEDDDQDEDEEEREGGKNAVDSDVDDIDFDNFKGIYFNDDPNRKYQDPETGCHFEYYDLCKRLSKLKELRKKIDKELGILDTLDSPAVQQQQPPEIKKSESTKTKPSQLQQQQLLPQNQQKRPSQGGLTANNQQQQQHQIIANNNQQQNNNQVLTLQRRQIRGLENNQQVTAHHQQQDSNQMRVDWLGGRNIQNYINELKQKMGGQGFRSKSHEKAQHLLMDKNNQQHSQRGHNQQQIGMINQVAMNPAINAQQHRKQQSQMHQQEQLQRLPSQGRGAAAALINSGSNQDLNNINKTPESNKKRSRGELSSGGLGNAYSYERRTYDARAGDHEFQIGIQGGQIQNIYTDNSTGGRQFRNSNYSSGNNKQLLGSQDNQLYMKAQSIINSRQQPQGKTAYGNLTGSTVGQTNSIQQRKTRNSGGFVVPQNQQSNSISHQIGVTSQKQQLLTEEQEKMSPYFIKQKQQSLALSSQQQQKRKAQMIIDHIEISGSNPYSRNKVNDQIKTTYSQKTQDLLQSVQKNSSLINNIKYGGPLIGSNAGKRIIPANIQFRKSFGGPTINQQPITGVRESLSKEGNRPTTGKLKQNSQDQQKFNKLAQNDRSRQKGGLIAALPSSQQQKSVNNAIMQNQYMNVAQNNQYFINKSINSFKN